MMRLFISSALLFCCLNNLYGADGGGRGGPFVEYHVNTLTAFDTSVSGNPVVIGGIGFGWATKTFRLGGGGAGGFLWNGSDNLEFGMGYGGVVGEYTIVPWLIGRLMIGGGGYAIAKVTSESDSSRTYQKLDSGSFILFHPSLIAEVKVHSWCFVSATIGYFLPNKGKLHSMTVGLNLNFGSSGR